MSRTIVAFSGPRACGKSTIAEKLCSEYGYTRMAFADAVRSIASSLNPTSAQDRLFLADVGQALRACVPDFSTLAMEHRLQTVRGPIVIEDVRFPIELEYCRSIGAFTVRFEIDRDTQIKRLGGRESDLKNLLALIDCEDEKKGLEAKEWDLKIDAVGDFNKIAAVIHGRVKEVLV